MSRATLDVGPITLDGYRVTVPLSPSSDLNGYFRESTFWYESSSLPDPHSVPDAILVIPALGSLVTMAWATGATLRLGEVDRRFLDGLDRIRDTFASLYPHFAITQSRIEATAVDVDVTPTGPTRTGLLFSGGVDSNTSLIEHREIVTDLFSIWGADVRTGDTALWEQSLVPLIMSSTAGAQADKHVIKSNLREFLDELRLCREFGSGLTNASWWGGVQHGLGLTTLTAPIAFDRGIGRLLIASTHSEAFSLPWGSMPAIDRDIAWSGTSVEHDGFHRTRQAKLSEVIAPYIVEAGGMTIAACYVPGRGGEYANCGICEKCVRTEAGLLLAGVDPAKCGFPMTAVTFATARERFTSRKYHLGGDEVFMWQDIQAAIPETLDGIPDPGGFHDFLGWLRRQDMEALAAPVKQGAAQKAKADAMYLIRKGFRLLPFPVQQRIYELRSGR